MKFGSITTGIIADGLILNIDPANRASYPKTGTIVNDTIGTNNSTLQSSGMFENTNSGVFDFDGGTNYVLLPSTFQPYNLTELTISAWFNPTSGDSQNLNIFGADQVSGFPVFGILSYGTTGYFIINNRFVNLNNWVNNVNLNQWNQVVGVFSGSSKGNYMRVYFNNSSDASSNIPSIPSSTGTFTVTTQSRIGVGAGYGYFLGSMGNFHIYNRALSPTEILHNYNALKGRFE
tara:strand:- start:3787 stop:4485 length:699 start_codon:yes stop_codon:yes gene_type:complete